MLLLLLSMWPIFGFILLGAAITVIDAIWVIYRIVKGLRTLNDGKPMGTA